MSFGKGQTLPVRRVKCRECGTAIQRKSYWRNPSCKKCSKRRARVGGLDRDMKLRMQARRYRILLAISPYRSFEELYQALKIRNPHTRGERYDLAIEQRARA